MKNSTVIKYLIYILVLIVVIILVGGFYCWYQFYIPLSSQAAEQEFLIEKGMGTKEIASSLKEAGMVRSANFFNFYVWIRGFHQHLQAGTYLLSPSYNIKRVAEILTAGKIYQEIAKITIPEGFTNEQINKRLSETAFKEKISLAGLKISDFSKDYEFLAEVHLSNFLQGFLFPDTYFFDPEAVVGEVVKKMLDNFEQKVSPGLRRGITAQGRKLYDILKMASLLEKEVKSQEDRKIVAGIFWQRINNSQPLESCATIAYIIGEEKPRYSFEETRSPSPYNTYLNPGLPPSPINNPGLEAILAVVYSQESTYNYFLTDPETGQTIFAKTLDEHEQNKLKYFK